MTLHTLYRFRIRVLVVSFALSFPLWCRLVCNRPAGDETDYVCAYLVRTCPDWHVST